jgi:hypothetical protein
MPWQDFYSKGTPSSIHSRYISPRLFADQSLTAKVIFARMGITFVMSSIYMWWTKVPHFPMGARGVRGWLVLRAAFGFGGLYCLYCESW